jgi:hypothetical protein
MRIFITALSTSRRSSFLLALLIALVSLVWANAALAGTGGKGGGNGTGCSPYVCPNFSISTFGDGFTDVYGGGTSQQQASGDTRAWDEFISSAVGKNYKGDSITEGAVDNELGSSGGGSLQDCQGSAYIWALMETDVKGDAGSGTSWDELPQYGQASSDRLQRPTVPGDSSTLPFAEVIRGTTATNGADSWSRDDRTAAVQHVEQEYSASSPWIIICSYYPGSVHHQSNPPVCPTRTSSGVDQWIDESGQQIPTGDSAAQAGTFCYFRNPDVSTTYARTSKTASSDKTTRSTEQRTVPAANSPVKKTYYGGPVTWSVDVVPDVTGGTYGTLNGTHPGTSPWIAAESGKVSAWGYLIGDYSSTSSCPSAARIDTARTATATEPEATVSLPAEDQASEAQGGVFLVQEFGGSNLGLETLSTYKQNQERVRVDKGEHVVTTITSIETDHITNYSFSLPSSQWNSAGTGVMTSAPATVNFPPVVTSTSKPGAGGSVSYNPDWHSVGPEVYTGCSSKETGLEGVDYPVRQFQIITSHADPTGFDRAVSGVPLSSTLPQVDSKYSDGAVTQDYGNPDNAALGYSQGDRSGLFDKLAAYSGGSSSGSPQDSYTFFRDGNYHRVALPFWNLSYSDGVSRNPSQLTPISTAINIWSYSSPQPSESQVDGGTQQCLYPNTGYAACGLWNLFENLGDSSTGPPGEEQSAVNSASPPGPSLFGGNPSGSPSPQLQFDGVSSYNYNYESMFTGAAPLMTSSIWASNSNAPVVLSGYQVYQPLLPLNEPVSNIGFGLPGGGQTYQTGIVSTPWLGIVFATHSKTDVASADITGGMTGFDVVSGSTGSQEFSNSSAPVDSMDCLGASLTVPRCDFNPTVKKLDDSGAGTGYTALTSAASKQNPLWTSINFVRGTGE